jgi:hypothetical protein
MSFERQMANEFFGWVIAAIPKLYELARAAGSRDLFLASLDGALAVSRKKVDADLEAKHDHETRPGKRSASKHPPAHKSEK